MTVKEAINQLQDAKDGYQEYLSAETIDMAIKALEREPHKDVIDDIKVLTNGDMIKAMFPKAWISNYIDIDNKCTLYIDDKMEVDAEVDIDWWNAPYKAESEE